MFFDYLSAFWGFGFLLHHLTKSRLNFRYQNKISIVNRTLATLNTRQGKAYKQKVRGYRLRYFIKMCYIDYATLDLTNLKAKKRL